MKDPSRRAVFALPLAAAALPAAAQPAGEDFAGAERAILAGRAPNETGIAVEIPRHS